MNIFQRIILILGAVILVVAIWTTPYYTTIKGMKVPSSSKGGYVTGSMSGSIHATIDIDRVKARSIAIVGATVLLFFAFKDIKKKGG